jgi:hypothetical protein
VDQALGYDSDFYSVQAVILTTHKALPSHTFHYNHKANHSGLYWFKPKKKRLQLSIKYNKQIDHG